MYTLFLTLRYLRRHRIVYFCIIAVMLGIMLLTVTSSIFNGFSVAMKERLRGMQSHLTVERTAADLYIEDYESLVAEIRKLPNVLGATPRLEYMAQHQSSRGIVPMTILGIDPEGERNTSDLERFFREGGKRDFSFLRDDGGKPGVKAAMAGRQTPFDEGVRFHLTAFRLGAMKPIFCTSEFESVGTFRTGMNEYDSALLVMSLEAAQAFLKLGPPDGPPRVNQIAINVRDYERNWKAVHEAIGPILARQQRVGYHSKRWETIKETLFRAVQQEKVIQTMLLCFIIGIAGFNIVAIYVLMVRSKARDIGVVKALGGSTGGVAGIFLMSGLFLSLIGAFIGTVLGLLLSYYANPVADAIQVSTAEAATWTPTQRMWACLACLAGATLLVGLRVAAFLKWRGAAAIWKGVLIPLTVLGLALAGHLSFLLVVALPEGAWKNSFAAILTLIGLAYVLIAGSFVWRWRGEGRLPKDQLELVLMPGGVIYWVSFLAVIIGAISFGVMAPMEFKPRWPGLELFPDDIYYLDRIPAEVDYTFVIFGIASAAVVGLVSSIFPAFLAARQPAVEAIRHE